MITGVEILQQKLTCHFVTSLPVISTTNRKISEMTMLMSVASLLIHHTTSLNHHTTSLIHHTTSLNHTTTSLNHTTTSLNRHSTSLNHHTTSLNHTTTSLNRTTTSLNHTTTSLDHHSTSLIHHTTLLIVDVSDDDAFQDDNIATFWSAQHHHPIQHDSTSMTSQAIYLVSYLRSLDGLTSEASGFLVSFIFFLHLLERMSSAILIGWWHLMIASHARTSSTGYRHTCRYLEWMDGWTIIILTVRLFINPLTEVFLRSSIHSSIHPSVHPSIRPSNKFWLPQIWKATSTRGVSVIVGRPSTTTRPTKPGRMAIPIPISIIIIITITATTPPFPTTHPIVCTLRSTCLQYANRNFRTLGGRAHHLRLFCLLLSRVNRPKVI